MKKQRSTNLMASEMMLAPAAPARRRAEREEAPVEAREAFDADAFNRGVETYRELARDGGLDAALSHHARQPTQVIGSHLPE
jgi:hypothetical protein